ncbi:MAG: hypothetical protein JWM58_2262 [Rhizobium sp.]|nr:hypothetical protein [Rhizobium sp.]
MRRHDVHGDALQPPAQDKTMNNKYAILLTAAGVFAAAATALEAADIQTDRDGVPIAQEEDSYGGVKIGYLACDIGEGAGGRLGEGTRLHLPLQLQGRPT